MKKLYINELVKFLIYNHAYYDFLYNFELRGKCRFNVYLKKTEPHKYIGNAFTWCETPQSHEYWARLSFKWRDKLNDLGYDK